MRGMTIRGYLLRRQLLASVACSVGCLVIAGVTFQLADPATHRYSAYAIVALALAVMPLQWLVRARLIRCPKCGASLGARGVGSRRSCPRCGMRFDQHSL